jgi:hypothetical protein
MAFPSVEPAARRSGRFNEFSGQMSAIARIDRIAQLNILPTEYGQYGFPDTLAFRVAEK